MFLWYEYLQYLFSFVFRYMMLRRLGTPNSGIYMEDEAGRWEEPEVMGDSKETVPSRPSKTDAHVDPQRLW